jgi:uncharacterized protein (TIGR02246 family)
MKNQLLGFALSALLLGPGGFALADSLPQKGDIMSDDQQQIGQLLERYETALNSSDVDAVLALYADDGVFMPSSAPTASGTEAVRKAYEFVFSTIRLDIRFTVYEIAVEGSMAFAHTGSKGQVTVLAEGVTVPEENRELFVFQKQDGAWKISRYMFNKTS